MMSDILDLKAMQDELLALAQGAPWDNVPRNVRNALYVRVQWLLITPGMMELVHEYQVILAEKED